MSTESQGPLIAVVGGGISGLATALAIHDRSPAARLVVLEPEPHVGGKIRTLEGDGFTCEWGVNGFLNKEPRTLELCQRLGLEQRLLPASNAFKNRYIYTRARLRAVKMHPLKFLFSGILPFGAKLRLVRELWIPRRAHGDDEAGADETVADFARRRVGPGAFKVLVDPMQTGIFAGDPERMSVASCFPRVVEVEREYGSLIRGMGRLAKERRKAGDTTLPGAGPSGHLTSFRGGMQSLVERLADELGKENIRLNSRVTTLQRDAEGCFTMAMEGKHGPQMLVADGVVLACPAHQAADITAELDPELSASVGQIPYSPLVVACLGFPRDQVGHPMDGFGFLVPRDEGLRLLGALWTSTLFPERAPEGHVLMRVMIGGARDAEVLELSDEELVQTVLRELRQVHKPASVGDPSFARVFRHRNAIPQYLVGHAERISVVDQAAARLPGLFVTGNAYRGIGVNDCARNAHTVADQVLDWISRR